MSGDRHALVCVRTHAKRAIQSLMRIKRFDQVVRTGIRRHLLVGRDAGWKDEHYDKTEEILRRLANFDREFYPRFVTGIRTHEFDQELRKLSSLAPNTVRNEVLFIVVNIPEKRKVPSRQAEFISMFQIVFSLDFDTFVGVMSAHVEPYFSGPSETLTAKHGMGDRVIQVEMFRNECSGLDVVVEDAKPHHGKCVEDTMKITRIERAELFTRLEETVRFCSNSTVTSQKGTRTFAYILERMPRFDEQHEHHGFHNHATFNRLAGDLFVIGVNILDHRVNQELWRSINDNPTIKNIWINCSGSDLDGMNLSPEHFHDQCKAVFDKHAVRLFRHDL